jgi:hypothetical protein
MTLKNYYQTVKQKIESDQFTFKFKDKSNLPTRESCIKNSHLESIHYLMFEFLSDRKDSRKKRIFDYVCVPKDVNQGELDIDFSLWKTDDFLREIMKIKN